MRLLIYFYVIPLITNKPLIEILRAFRQFKMIALLCQQVTITDTKKKLSRKLYYQSSRNKNNRPNCFLIDFGEEIYESDCLPEQLK